jgi:hypothetical protein
MSYFYNNYNISTKDTQVLDNNSGKNDQTKPIDNKPAEKDTTANTEAPYKVGKEYTLQVDLKVRSGAGTSYNWLNRSELSSYGKQHSYNQSKAVFKAGTVVEALEVKKNSKEEYWIRTYSGWLCARTKTDIYIK